jgi:hypothetical protein
MLEVTNRDLYHAAVDMYINTTRTVL